MDFKDSFRCGFKDCGKSYNTKYNLKRHTETFHLHIKRFQCEVCSRFLSSKQNLEEHKFTHSEECLFNCSEPGCLQSFRQRSQLSNHNKMHRELKVLKEKLKSSKKDEKTCLQESEYVEEVSDFSETVVEPTECIQLPPITTPQLMVNLPNILI